MAFLDKILGDPNKRTVGRMDKDVEKVNAFEEEVKKLSDEELKQATQNFRKRLNPLFAENGGGEKLDDLLHEAFAYVREAGRRTLKQRHFDVQLVGGMALHQGKIAEMKTGEGKTLTATLAVYLNALEGKGVHVVTVNDYLARRDAVWMGQIYAALGMSVGCITHDQAFVYDASFETPKKEDLSPEALVNEEEKLDEERDTKGAFEVVEQFLRPVARKQAYAADITYGTNNEYGFDYLRDNMAQSLDQLVQRPEAEGGLHFAIVDEVDSILIDEARTPLIISSPDQESGELYKTFAHLVPSLKEEEDYEVDEKMRAVSITEVGITKIEQALGIKNLYDAAEGGGIRYVHHLEQALKARALFHRDKEYVVRNGEVVIVDEFTGRMMPGRRYSEGLHQAIEAKENVAVQQESRTLATITFQNYFRLYKKLAGMTGTAFSSAEEFDKVYKLEVVVIPTNKPLLRKTMPDLVFRNTSGKYKAVIREIKERHAKGQPVLVGTTSIEKNELLGKMLEVEGIAHHVLNAKNNEKEGEIIAQAGRFGNVTIATNMAGRGVDIILGGNPPSKEEAEKVKEAGGLHVIGTERHEARRIDDQLRGRAGRQGDPGSSQFFVSLEDDLMRIFGGDKIRGMLEALKVPEDEPIESRLVSGAIESAQQKIEGFNFDTRKQVLDYDEVLNKQRINIYKRRREILEGDKEKVSQNIQHLIEDFIARLVSQHTPHERINWNIDEICNVMKAIAGVEGTLREDIRLVIDQPQKNDEDVRKEMEELLMKKLLEVRAKKHEGLEEVQVLGADKFVLLRTIDMLWMDHLEAMDYMRDSVKLRAYGQKDPLVEYKNEGARMFRELMDAILSTTMNTLFHVEVRQAAQAPVQQINIGGSSAPALPATAPASQHTDVENHKEIVGRNDPCPCGSGKKYKKCHGA